MGVRVIAVTEVSDIAVEIEKLESFDGEFGGANIEFQQAVSSIDDASPGVRPIEFIGVDPNGFASLAIFASGVIGELSGASQAGFENDFEVSVGERGVSHVQWHGGGLLGQVRAGVNVVGDANKRKGRGDAR